jgi:predicted NBD/HSP70 family sugar kinase
VTGAVDIGGTKLAVGLVDECGKVVAKEETPTGSDSATMAVG